eukprot:scaffold7634_cov417-Prasinococcus_capsulatus_cf.AAC.1
MRWSRAAVQQHPSKRTAWPECPGIMWWCPLAALGKKEAARCTQCRMAGYRSPLVLLLGFLATLPCIGKMCRLKQHRAYSVCAESSSHAVSTSSSSDSPGMCSCRLLASSAVPPA